MKRLYRLFACLCVLFLSQTVLAANPLVEMKTSMGSITLELLPEKAPRSVENFLRYVKEGFYDGLVFHRVIPGFMIQGGGFDAKMKQKPTHGPIMNEANNGLRNDAGWIAMARTNVVHSASSQFFINLVDNPSLNYGGPDNYGYAAFGKVVKGMEVVKAIGAVSTGIFPVGPMTFRDVPDVPVIIESVKLIPNSK